MYFRLPFKLLHFVKWTKNIFALIQIMKQSHYKVTRVIFVICNLIFYFTGRVRMKMSNLFASQKGHKIKLLIFLNLDFYGNTCKILKSEEIVTSFRSLMNFCCL